jgi:transporter family protein
MQTILAPWLFWALLSAVFAALTAIFAKIGVSDINADFATFLRTIVIVGVLAAIVTATRQWQPISALTPKASLFLVLSAVGTGGSWWCYFRAMKLGDAAKVAPVDKLSVVLVAVIAAVFLGEKLTVTGWIGVMMVTLGTVLIAMGV